MGVSCPHGLSTSSGLSGITRRNQFPDKGALKGRMSLARTSILPAAMLLCFEKTNKKDRK
jgi:hypothetical protein